MVPRIVPSPSEKPEATRVPAMPTVGHMRRGGDLGGGQLDPELRAGDDLGGRLPGEVSVPLDSNEVWTPQEGPEIMGVRPT